MPAKQDTKENDRAAIAKGGQQYTSHTMLLAKNTLLKNKSEAHKATGSKIKPNATSRGVQKPKITECRVLKPENSQVTDTRNNFSGLEGECSKTFAKGSYKVSGLLVTNSKHNSRLASRKSSQRLSSAKKVNPYNRGIYNRTKRNENSENESSCDQKARARYMNRKRELNNQRSQWKPKPTLSTAASVKNSSFTHRKAMSYYGKPN